MRLLNLFLLTLLCIAIPIQGVAGLLLPNKSCPAESAGISTVETANDHSCCQDPEKIVKTGKVCKTEQNCQSATAAMLNAMENRLPFAVGAKMAVFSNRLSLSFDPFAAWRPPNRV